MLAFFHSWVLMAAIAASLCACRSSEPDTPYGSSTVVPASSVPSASAPALVRAPPPPDPALAEVIEYRIPLSKEDKRYAKDAWPRPMNVVTTKDTVFWNDSRGRLWKAPKLGGKTELVVDRGHEVGSFLIEQDEVYFWNKRGILTVSSGGGTPTLLVADSLAPLSAVSDENYWYYTSFEGNSVRRATRGGGKPEVFTRAGKGSSIAIDSSHLFVADYQVGTLTKVPLRGPRRPLVLVSAQKGLVDLAVDDTNVYYVTERDNAVRRMDKKGGKPKTLIRGVSVISGGLALDKTHVYWANKSPVKGYATITRAPKKGGTPEMIHEHLVYPGGVHVDNDRVYVATGDQGVIGVLKPR